MGSAKSQLYRRYGAMVAGPARPSGRRSSDRRTVSSGAAATRKGDRRQGPLPWPGNAPRASRSAIGVLGFGFEGITDVGAVGHRAGSGAGDADAVAGRPGG